MELDQQTAIITGGSRGIGLAIASALATRGANVAVWARERGAVDAAVSTVTSSAAGTVGGYIVDVRREDAVDAAVAQVEQQLGPVTLLVNNAGTPGPAGREWQADPSEWWECVETSVRGSFLCARAVLPGMLQRGSGRIVEMASLTGAAASPRLSARSVAKAAVIRHAENLDGAVAGTGVHVFALNPGMVDTTLLDSYHRNREVAAFLERVPAEAFTTPEAVGAFVALIAAGAADTLSGCLIDVAQDLEELRATVDASERSELYRLSLTTP